MIRTQLYLPKALYQIIRSTAAKEQKPAAQLIRELLTIAITTKQNENAGTFFLQLADKGVKGLGTQGSLLIDKDLYGDK